jgi:GT2 family glycosyltransferase
MDSIEFQSFINKTIVILVLYKVNLNESDSFNSLSKSLQDKSYNLDIVIYDNSPLPMIDDKHDTYLNWNIHYIHDKANPGVGKAYNEGFKIGKRLNKEWLLLLDQDTKFKGDALIKYWQAVKSNPDTFLFAPLLISEYGDIYSPCRYLSRRGFPLKKKKFGLQSFENRSLLNSGLLINMDAFELAGGYNEDLKLDFSDFEFIDRYKTINQFFFIIDTECLHSFSSEEDNINKSFSRFNRYCESIKVLNKIYSDALILWFFAFARACKLSFRFKSTNFLITFYKKII